MDFFLSKIIKRPRSVVEIRDPVPHPEPLDQLPVEANQPSSCELLDAAEATKSTKRNASSGDITATPTKQPRTLLEPLPTLITSDATPITSPTKEVIENKNLLTAAFPIDVASSDDEVFLECNTTPPKNLCPKTDVNETITYASKVLGDTLTLLQDTEATSGPSAVTKNESTPEVDAPTLSLPVESGPINHSLGQSPIKKGLEAVSETKTGCELSTSEIILSQNVTIEIDDLFNKSAPLVYEPVIEPANLAVERSEPCSSSQDEGRISADDLSAAYAGGGGSDGPKITLDDDHLAQAEELLKEQSTDNDRLGQLNVTSEITTSRRISLGERPAVLANTLNETVNLDTGRNNTSTPVVPETESTDLAEGYDELGAASNLEYFPESTPFPTYQQIDRIREFHANPNISIDSLEVELDSDGHDCSFESVEMKPLQPQQPTTPSDQMLTTAVADDGFPNKRSPNVSEMFPNLDPHDMSLKAKSTNDTTIGDMNKIFQQLTVCDETANLSQVSADSIVDKMPSVNTTFPAASATDPDFQVPAPTSLFGHLKNQQPQVGSAFQSNDTFMVLNSNDFDFLQSRGGNSSDSEDDRRSSLLVRFDPLLKKAAPLTNLNPTSEESEEERQSSIVVESNPCDTQPLLDLDLRSPETSRAVEPTQRSPVVQVPSPVKPAPADEAMSFGLERDSNNMEIETTNAYMNNKTEQKVIDLDDQPLADKKNKFGYLDENIRMKMEEYETSQEQLRKRIADKDKSIAKTGTIIDTYEKTLTELVAEKEKLMQQFEASNEELRRERDAHHHHLMSLEVTFSDLHKKYERSKEFSVQLQERVDTLSAEKARIAELIQQQELHYEKLKSHALNQLDIANSTLEKQTKNHIQESAVLKAQLKREEISKNSFQDLLNQKTKENDELMKICDELINGQKS